MTHEVDILLATYQGAPFLKEQLQSLLDQSYPHIRILARDDGSTDQSLELLKRGPVTLLTDEGNLGCIGNFSTLLSHASAPYIAFSDQDDRWHPFKIEEALRAMQKAERSLPAGTPILVHSDLTVADQNLQEIAPSFWKYSGLKPHQHSSFNRLLVQNCVTGCAMMINRPLAELASPIPREAKMHDWWLALAASAFGTIIALDRPSMLYRQHASNSIGAQKLGISTLVKRYLKGGLEKARLGRKMQAQAFFERFENKLSHQQKAALDALIHADERCWLKNNLHAYHQDIYRSGTLSNCARFFMKNPY